MPTALTPRRLSDLKQAVLEDSDEGKTLSKMEPPRRRLYNKVRRDITEKTEGKYTPAEYHHLTMMYLLLDEADAYIESVGGPQNIDPDVLNQVRLMRDSFLARLKESREEQKTVGSILKDAKEAMIKLRDRAGNEAVIIKSDNSESLLELVEAEMSKDVSKDKKESTEVKKESVVIEAKDETKTSD